MSMVELIYDLECPNVLRTRTQLMAAFMRAGVVPQWSEYVSSDPATPAHTRGYGSPTILVEGRDILGAMPESDACCRVYRDDTGAMTGVPPVAAIAAAIRHSAEKTRRTGSAKWRRGLAMLPAVGAALLPKVACPACWPAYAGVLGTLGLGFLMDASVLLPLTAVFLTLAVGALAFRARARRGYSPFALGLVAAAVVLLGKFSFDSDEAMYAGLGLLVAASLWNSWPRPRNTACPACPSLG